jgi:hypothetical protein
MGEGLIARFWRRRRDRIERADVIRQILDERYANFTGNPPALRICEQLAEEGLMRVVWDGPTCWRGYFSNEQRKRLEEELHA